VLVQAVVFEDFILAIHILAAIAGFGIVFAFPVLLSAAARTDPAVTPWLLRARQRIGRYVVNPGLLVVVIAGVYLASHKHAWSDFYVDWGIFAVLVIGALEGSIIIRRSGRLADLAERDLAATAMPAGGRRTSATWSEEYVAQRRIITRVTWALQALVVITVFVMATHAGA
jgi:uncharacterized membrane protein